LKIKYFNEKLKNTKKTLLDKSPISFNDLMNFAGWSERDLTFVLKNLLDSNIIDEFYDEDSEKILYKLIQTKHEETITIRERIEGFYKQSN